MKAFYDRQGKNVFEHLPVTFHVKRFDDDAWKDFTRYYAEDQQAHSSEGEGKRLWIVKPGENSNRGNGITIYSDY
jgi:glutathione synthase/RimK-type ligase-like ATP-grasp enzyme